MNRRTRPSQDTDAEEGSKLDLLNGRFGSSTTDIGNAYHPRPVEVVVVVVTREVFDKGASMVQHVGGKTGMIHTSSKLQAIEKAKPEDKGREDGYDEDTICLCRGKLDVRDGLYSVRYRICSYSGEPIHEQSRKSALERSTVDTLVIERRHLEYVLPIWLR